MTFDQETWPRLRFVQNPLKVVVFQARFPTAHALGVPETQAAIQRAVADVYPKPLDPVQEVSFGISPQGPTASQVVQTAIRFGDAAEESVFAVGPGMASYETTRYRGWDQFEPHIVSLLALVEEHGGPTEVTRLGLRYVDELTVEGAQSIGDWSDLVAERVVGTEDSLARDPRLLESDQRTAIRVDDDLVTVRHGFAKRAIEGQGERSLYFLDTDISTIGPRPFDVDALRTIANRYHLWMRNIFGRTLSPAGIERLGGTEQ